ncbi:hypothetical protein [Jatrophihabitans sp.]|jgi:uncharacterized protein involved in propanediol utilization|uniref:GHMP family kinase ATP-binding protein n=1 Tax=Jatrophihabitans sp. TaxID=1932789 RepID=UPI002EFF272B
MPAQTLLAPPAGTPGPAGHANLEVIGIGFAPAHHGELLQGMFLDDAGVPHRALVTLPQPALGTRAVFRPSYTHGGVLGPSELIKVRRAAILTLGRLPSYRSPAKGGQIEITSTVPHGIGMGSSTSDVTATIRAVADSHGHPLEKEEVARLAVLAECASDSVMICDQVVLFAQREGTVLEVFGQQLPPMLVLGCDTAPEEKVDTLRLPPAPYDRSEIAQFGVLRAALRRAVAKSDLALLGRVATASARINQRYLPKPQLEMLLRLCAEHGGCGVQVAHSGTVAGLIFDARAEQVAANIDRCADALSDAGLAVTGLIDPAGRGDRQPAPAGA